MVRRGRTSVGGSRKAVERVLVGARLNIQQLSQSSKYITFKHESRRTRVDRSHIGGHNMTYIIGTSGGRSTPKTQLGRPMWCFGASKSLKRRSPTLPRGCHVRGVRSVGMTEDDEAGAMPWNEATCDFLMPWRVRQWPTGPWLGAAAHTGDPVHVGPRSAVAEISGRVVPAATARGRHVSAAGTGNVASGPLESG